MKVYKGDIYYADLDPVKGSEQGGIRPIIVLQNDVGNIMSSTILVAPLTKKFHNKPNLPTHITINNKKLKYESIVLLEQVKVIDKERLKHDFVCRVSKKVIKKIDKALLKSFGIGVKR